MLAAIVMCICAALMTVLAVSMLVWLVQMVIHDRREWVEIDRNIALIGESRVNGIRVSVLRSREEKERRNAHPRYPPG